MRNLVCLLLFLFFRIFVCGAQQTTSSDTLINFGACISNPCINDGICTQTPSGFLCTCVNGHIGRICEKKADDCPTDNNVDCNNGECKLDQDGLPHCVCDDGYTGATCLTSTENCSLKPCKNSGVCNDLKNGYECKCPQGTSGVHCQIRDSLLEQCVDSCDEGYDFDGKCWHNDTQTITAGWGYGELICNSLQTCFDAKNDSGHEYIEVQLKPIHMQENDELMFKTDGDAALYDYHFIPHILPMEAKSKDAFIKCNTSEAIPLASDPVKSKLRVNESLLSLGTQYFIADMNALHRCVFGLRLNVTVKQHQCIDPRTINVGFCNGHGKCFTDFTREHYECLCCDGYIGKFCEIEDPCYAEPCQNNGVCEIQELGYNKYKHKCRCPNGFKGNNCAEFINFCTSAPCQHGGTCNPKKNGYDCTCKDGFHGDHCEINKDECAVNPCLNGGQCHDGSNSYYCACKPGYKGRLCEVNVDDCASGPCMHGSCLDDINNYTCACAAGFSGRNCEVQLNECLSQPCVNGKCVDETNGFSCSCGIGYTGMLCEIKLNLCLHSQYCVTKNAVSCVDHGANVTCQCSEGWSGENCGVNVDDCEGHKCENGAFCVDGMNVYTCQCLKGYSGKLCEVPPPVADLVDLSIMTDDCNKFKNVDGLDTLEQSVISLLKAACDCQLDTKTFISGSAYVTCEDDVSGRFVATLASQDMQFKKSIICGMKKVIKKGTTPTLDHNTFVTGINDHSFCEEFEAKPKKAEENSNATGILVGVLVGFLFLILLLVFIVSRVRNNRRVGVTKMYPKQATSFYNAAYVREDTPINSPIPTDEGSSRDNTLDTVDEQCPKWAVEYDNARKRYERSSKAVPTGRLFDVHNPGGNETNI